MELQHAFTSSIARCSYPCPSFFACETASNARLDHHEIILLTSLARPLHGLPAFLFDITRNIQLQVHIQVLLFIALTARLLNALN